MTAKTLAAARPMRPELNDLYADPSPYLSRIVRPDSALGAVPVTRRSHAALPQWQLGRAYARLDLPAARLRLDDSGCGADTGVLREPRSRPMRLVNVRSCP